MTLAAGALGPNARAAAVDPANYPPARLGDRGQHPGANAVAHALRDGTFWRDAGAVRDTQEAYDLVVVGGGISGLAAAVSYRQQAGAAARVLVLENHDDVGGHARRNEFLASSGQRLIGYGGSQSLQTPSYFSPAVHALLRSLQLDLSRFPREFFAADWAERRELGEGVFFDRESFGTDRLIQRTEHAADWVPRTPLTTQAQRDLIALIDAPRDYLPGLDRAAKRRRLAAMTYAQFLRELVGADDQLLAYFAHSTTGYFGVGIDATSALDAYANGNPGFAAMDLGAHADAAMSPSGRLALTDPDEYVYHFPDGNHGVARALVRELNFAALPARSMEDLVTTRLDYGRLDDTRAAARIRLNSTVVKVRQGSNDRVDVTYARGTQLESVRARHVVLACWHRVIPYLCDGLPASQVEALNDQRKVPLIYTNVLLRNWRAFAQLGIRGFSAPGHFWHGAELDFPVSMGDYRYAQAPTDPVLLHLSAIPTVPGKAPREQWSQGRAHIGTLSFESLERSIRDLLARALDGGGFDPRRDIEAICVNRWAHGYAVEYMRPWDAYWPDGPLPCDLARRRFGNIAIANSDSGAYAYAHSAIDQAIRAVRELLGTPPNAPAITDFPGPPRDRLGLA